MHCWGPRFQYRSVASQRTEPGIQEGTSGSPFAPPYSGDFGGKSLACVGSKGIMHACMQAS